MEIADLLITPEILDKLLWKHSVIEMEVRQIFHDAPRYRDLSKRVDTRASICISLSEPRIPAGICRYSLYIKKTKDALIVTARDMTESERKRYAKK